MLINFFLNGKKTRVDARPGEMLLETLRNLEMYSVKFGCDHGECGACTILVDDLAMNACLLLTASISGRKIETLEGLNSRKRMQEFQQKFLDEGAIQCGYCTPGMLLSLEALYREIGQPDETRIREALAGNLCRCTGYVKPVGALLK